MSSDGVRDYHLVSMGVDMTNTGVGVVVSFSVNVVVGLVTIVEVEEAEGGFLIVPVK